MHIVIVFFPGGISGDEKPRRLTFLAPNTLRPTFPGISGKRLTQPSVPDTAFWGKPFDPFDFLTRLDYLLVNRFYFLIRKLLKCTLWLLYCLNERKKYKVLFSYDLFHKKKQYFKTQLINTEHRTQTQDTGHRHMLKIFFL